MVRFDYAISNGHGLVMYSLIKMPHGNYQQKQKQTVLLYG